MFLFFVLTLLPKTLLIRSFSESTLLIVLIKQEVKKPMDYRLRLLLLGNDERSKHDLWAYLQKDPKVLRSVSEEKDIEHVSKLIAEHLTQEEPFPFSKYLGLLEILLQAPKWIDQKDLGDALASIMIKNPSWINTRNASTLELISNIWARAQITDKEKYLRFQSFWNILSPDAKLVWFDTIAPKNETLHIWTLQQILTQPTASELLSRAARHKISVPVLAKLWQDAQAEDKKAQRYVTEIWKSSDSDTKQEWFKLMPPVLRGWIVPQLSDADIVLLLKKQDAIQDPVFRKSLVLNLTDRARTKQAAFQILNVLPRDMQSQFIRAMADKGLGALLGDLWNEFLRQHNNDLKLVFQDLFDRKDNEYFAALLSIVPISQRFDIMRWIAHEIIKYKCVQPEHAECIENVRKTLESVDEFLKSRIIQNRSSFPCDLSEMVRVFGSHSDASIVFDPTTRRCFELNEEKLAKSIATGLNRKYPFTHLVSFSPVNKNIWSTVSRFSILNLSEIAAFYEAVKLMDNIAFILTTPIKIPLFLNHLIYKIGHLPDVQILNIGEQATGVRLPIEHAIKNKFDSSMLKEIQEQELAVWSEFLVNFAAKSLFQSLRFPKEEKTFQPISSVALNSFYQNECKKSIDEAEQKACLDDAKVLHSLLNILKLDLVPYVWESHPEAIVELLGHLPSLGKLLPKCSNIKWQEFKFAGDDLENSLLHLDPERIVEVGKNKHCYNIYNLAERFLTILYKYYSPQIKAAFRDPKGNFRNTLIQLIENVLRTKIAEQEKAMKDYKEKAKPFSEEYKKLEALRMKLHQATDENKNDLQTQIDEINTDIIRRGGPDEWRDITSFFTANNYQLTDFLLDEVPVADVFDILERAKNPKLSKEEFEKWFIAGSDLFDSVKNGGSPFDEKKFHTPPWNETSPEAKIMRNAARDYNQIYNLYIKAKQEGNIVIEKLGLLVNKKNLTSKEKDELEELKHELSRLQELVHPFCGDLQSANNYSIERSNQFLKVIRLILFGTPEYSFFRSSRAIEQQSKKKLHDQIRICPSYSAPIVGGEY